MICGELYDGNQRQCWKLKSPAKKFLQRVNLLYIELKLWGLNYQTPPFYADFILKYRKNCREIYLLVDNSCNFKAISKNNILKQIYQGEK